MNEYKVVLIVFFSLLLSFFMSEQTGEDIVDKKIELEAILQNTPKNIHEHAFKMIQREAERIRQENHQRQLEQIRIKREQEIRKEQLKLRNSSLQNHKWLNFHATYYGKDCIGCSGITATGIDVQKTIYFKDLRIVAVDPAIIPLGTIVEIKTPNEKFKAIAADKGGAIKGYRLDILVESEEISVQYGRHDVQLRIVN